MGAPPRYDATVRTASQRVNAIAAQAVAGRKSEIEPGPHLIDLSQNPFVNRKPEYFIYIFNTVNREFVVARPQLSAKIVIPPCPPERKYIVAKAIPTIHAYRDERLDTGEQTIVGEYGERVAMDIVNPQNLSTQMWRAVNPNDETAWVGGDGGDDLSRRGVFWTVDVSCEACGTKIASARQVEKVRCLQCHEVFYPKPSDDDLKHSQSLVRKFAQSRIERASKISSDPRSQDVISPEDHWAADYMQVSPTWHTYMAPPEFCENCGGQIRGDVAVHMNTDIGILCVRDWRRAVEMGAKKLEDVPPDKRWWDETETETGTESTDKPRRGRPPKAKEGEQE